MKKILTILILITFWFSCDEKREVLDDNNIEEVFDEKLISSSIKGRYGQNPVDKLFDSYLETDEVLKTELNAYYELQKKIIKDKKPINLFLFNNEDFYNSAKNNSQSITDTVLSAYLIEILNKSKQNYLINSKAIIDIDSLLACNIELNNNLISAVKVIYSLSVLEVYQKSNLNLDVLIEDKKRLNKFTEYFNKKVVKEK